MKSLTSIAVGLGAAVALALSLTPSAQAHDAAYLDTQAAPHGGQVRMAGAFHYELVVVKDSPTVKDNAVVVYVTDHAGTKVATAGASGTVTLLAGPNKVTAVLKPDNDAHDTNRLKGTARYASTPDLKAVVSITLAGQAAEQARFTPLAVSADGHDGHDGHQH